MTDQLERDARMLLATRGFEDCWYLDNEVRRILSALATAGTLAEEEVEWHTREGCLAALEGWVRSRGS